MYFKPYIDETGLHIPLYMDIRDSLVDEARRIFGEDIYLEPDSQDYQFISAFAEKVNDANELAALVYNNRGPLTAIGSALDGVVKLNGVRRKARTHSQCQVAVTGDPGTKIYGGIVESRDGERWDIGDVAIPESGEVEVLATCRSSGPVYADAGAISKIVTQTRGWLSVVNRANAIPGRDNETDAALRARQAISTANPSKTVLQGISGGIAALLNVTRHRLYENDSGEPDANGIPGHSTAAVVEGGDEREIAQVLYLRKTPGSGTYGDICIEVESPETALEKPPPVCFFRPKYVDVYVRVEVKPLLGYTSQTPVDIRKNICGYLNSLTIGENLTVSALYVPAMAATPNIVSPYFSIQRLLIGMEENNLTAADLQIGFNGVTRGREDHILIAEV